MREHYGGCKPRIEDILYKIKNNKKGGGSVGAGG